MASASTIALMAPSMLMVVVGSVILVAPNAKASPLTALDALSLNTYSAIDV